ncbi:ABC transporter ATP-binding protein [Paramaledivibacter caminithermalis]|jgi:ABC-2 type transport system ATP-binding protein|uniref:ABC-2 type transport system ATP-binding protein n=1 Tax=Paramaledivibacter caminithermalis (strain DSM 15212 / CIP 107654 / DViRD3) TaxID=1121301 RepID=A0A1M6JML7_PARC5|nr:ABC transporter ATP-binding protein [Paramaledivibacter caminithermalis]SHJ47926.1 ABC-2 type transport system ATP-binding protein [Paramaledivibacter caminithermalis DSM 15212]
MLKVENLTKLYGKFKAVDNISLNIKEGEIFGFVGPNGAGKTTTFKMIATLLRPTSGKIYLDGMEVNYKNLKKVRNEIGYMPDFFGVYDKLKVTEYMDFYSDIAGIYGEEKNRIIKDLLQLVDLTHKKEAYVDSLSRGMKQRLCLARCLIHNPKLLILDEPASGMDPRARIQMKEILRELKKMGKTIIISSHILPELSELCTNIGIIEGGKIVVNGPVEEIMYRAKSNNIIKLSVLEKKENCIKLLKEEPLVKSVIENGRDIEIEFDGEPLELSNLMKRMLNQNIPLISFKPLENNLEDIFMEVTRGDGE